MNQFPTGGKSGKFPWGECGPGNHSQRQEKRKTEEKGAAGQSMVEPALVGRQLGLAV